MVTFLGIEARARADYWPQWRGPLGQGITSEKNLPPRAGSDSLKVLWKTPIPGEGCSSPIMSQGRVYLTTAYEEANGHAFDRPAFWATIILACCVTGLVLTRIPSTLRLFLTRRPVWMAVLGLWTMAAIALTAVVLAKPPWFWQFADPWTGTNPVPAELPWVESLNLRPAIVLACGSLALILIMLTPRLFSFVTLVVTLACSVLLGLIGWRPDWFFLPSQPWLAWLVTGGVGLFALAGSIGWLGESGKSRPAKIIMIGLGLALAGCLFLCAPHDEFGNPLSSLNRIAYLVPGIMLLIFSVPLCLCGSNPMEPQRHRGTKKTVLLSLLSVIVFVRANYLQPRTVRAVVCLDAQNGQVLWNTPVFVDAPERRHSLNSLATPTPACDGERVYAYFGSGLAALDTSGKLLWLKRDPDFASFIRYGAGSSVVLAGDRIIVYRDSEFMGHGDHLDDDIQSQSNRRPTALTAYDRSGAELWSIAPQFSHDSYMTPLVWTREDRLEVVIATWKTLAGFAVKDGSLLWTHSYPMQQVVPSPAVNGDCLIVTGGNLLPCPIVAVRAPTPTAPAQDIWFNRKTGGNIVSPVCWNGLLFSMSDLGVLTCRDAETGRIHWTERERLAGRFLASLVAGDGKLYAVNQEGTLHVLAADTTGSVLATHSLLENCSATPAIAGTVLFVRTTAHLHCIGSGE